MAESPIKYAGRVMRSLRLQAGLSRTRLAEASGVPEYKIRALELGLHKGRPTKEQVGLLILTIRKVRGGGA